MIRDTIIDYRGTLRCLLLTFEDPIQPNKQKLLQLNIAEVSVLNFLLQQHFTFGVSGL